MTNRHPRISLAALLVHSTLIQALVFLLRPATSYQALALDVSPAGLGAIGAVFAVVPLVLAVPAGTITDRIGSKIVILVGSATTVIAAVVFVLFGQTLLGIVVGTAILGAGHLGCIVGQQSTVAHIAGAGRLDAMFGYYTFAASLGQAIGPLLIPLAAGDAVRPNTTIMFLIGLGTSAVLLITGFAIRDARAPILEAGAPRPSPWAILKTPGVTKAIITSAMIVAAVDLTTIYIPAIGTERDIPAFAVGLLLAARAVASMASRLLLGVAANHLGRGRLMTTSIAIAATSLFAFALPVPWPVLFAVAAALGLGLGVGQPLTMSWVTEQVPAQQRGSALAIRLAGNRLSQVSIPAIVGTVAAATGAGTVFVVIGVLLAGMLLVVRGVRLDGDEQ